MMKERRKYFRAPLSLAVTFRDSEGKETEAFTATLGGGGLFLETFRPLPVNQEVSIEMHLPGNKDKTVLKGEVVWNRREYVEGSPPGMGIRFTRVPKKDQAMLNELISRVLVGGSEEGI